MAEYSFSLIPFPDPTVPDIQITGTVSRNKNVLAVNFMLTGRTDVILFPEAAKYPQRRDDLWKTTCFEIFLAMPENPEYWEFNMSPSGDWNAYHMDAYRQVGLREETCIQKLQFSLEKRIENITVEATVDLTSFIEERLPIQAEITSVIEDKNEHETYWALMHPGPHADFHRRESFIIQL